MGTKTAWHKVFNSAENILRNDTPPYFKKCLPNVVAIIDGTYLYIQKWKDFQTQVKMSKYFFLYMFCYFTFRN